MLCSHYRSETPDLIRFSNEWFYRGKLEFYPPAKVSGTGRLLRFVPEGIFSETAGQRSNPAEARAVVKLIDEHVRDASDKSLGVVTMNIPQMELVEELLLQTDSKVRAFCGDDQKFFLRNLETVQGDEMDRIILSLTYGPGPDGRFSAAVLGPLVKSGGERRLNVAITRSRQGMAVVSSLTSQLMATSGAQSEGFKCLKAFIEDLERSTEARDFGMSGRRFQRKADGVSNQVYCESPFEEAVVGFLEQEGYDIICQYGSGEFRIDIVVRDGDRNVLAIECDGKAYHQSLVARTRDRAREAILRQRGWKIHRVWSTNWWNFEEQEKQGIREAIAAARAAHSKR
jgi:very-short-patch-repair endonuclease